MNTHIKQDEVRLLNSRAASIILVSLHRMDIFFLDEKILSKNFASNFAFPVFLKQPITLSGGFPRPNQIATVKASNHWYHASNRREWEKWGGIEGISMSPTPPPVERDQRLLEVNKSFNLQTFKALCETNFQIVQTEK